MGYYPKTMLEEIHELVRIGYIRRELRDTWNKHRHAGEPRVVGGWYWETFDHKHYGTGLRSPSAAINDAYHKLVLHRQTPLPLRVRKPKLKVVRSEPAKRKAA